MYALVRSDPRARKQQGISFLLIDMKSPGIRVQPIELISGKSSFCQVFFDNVRVPRRQLVGALNTGWSVAKKLLAHERAAMSKFTEGGAPSHDPLEVAGPWCKASAGLVGQPVLRDRLAGVMMDAHAFGLTHRRMAERALAGEDVGPTAAIMKLVQTEQEVAKYEFLMQVMGTTALGWPAAGSHPGEGNPSPEAVQALDLTRAWLRAKTYTIAGGSSEIQLNLIAQRVLGLPTGGAA
jgi:hypothetical protein